jgi:transposase-like protein
MTESCADDGTSAPTKTEQWRERLAEHERSGLSVKQFCQERGITQWSFYAWRKRLREQGTVRFALVERGRIGQEQAPSSGLELILTTGERLRIGADVDCATLRAVLDVLRA